MAKNKLGLDLSEIIANDEYMGVAEEPTRAKYDDEPMKIATPSISEAIQPKEEVATTEVAEATEDKATETGVVVIAERKERKKATAVKEEAEPKRRKKLDTHKNFSFWARKEDVAKWQAYATCCMGTTKEELFATAINEYIKRHPLDKETSEMYQLALKFEMMKSGV